MKIIYKGFIALILVILESSLATIAIQVGGNSIGVVSFLFYSLVVGAVAMFAVAYFQDRCRNFFSVFKDRKTLIILFIVGILAYAVSRLSLTMGTLGTTPSASGILFRTYPLMIAILAPLFLRQRVTTRQFISLLFGFLAVGIVLSNGSLTTINFSEAPYIALILISAFATAVGTVVVNKYNVSSSSFILIASIASIIFTISLIMVYHISLPLSLSPATWLSVLLIGTVFGGVGSMLFYYAYKIFNQSFTGLVMLTVPFFTVIMAFLLLGTPMEPYYFLAAGVLMIGAYVQGSRTLNAPEHIKKSAVLKNIRIFDVTSAFIHNKSEVFHNCLKGGGRALAIKLDGNRKYENVLHAEIFRKHHCLAFTDKEPNMYTEKAEIEFINAIVSLNGQETLLIGVGNSDDIVSSLEEFISADSKNK